VHYAAIKLRALVGVMPLICHRLVLLIEKLLLQRLLLLNGQYSLRLQFTVPTLIDLGSFIRSVGCRVILQLRLTVLAIIGKHLLTGLLQE